MDKGSRIRKVTLLGLICNVMLSIVKLVIGLMGNSQAVVADALHSFSDTSTDLVILFGVKYWTAPPDDCHPYGHQKIESFITIVIGLILITVAAGIGYNGIISFLKDTREPLNFFVAIGPLLSIIVKEMVFKITYKVGIETNSSSVKANAWHHRTDALSSIPVLVAVIASSINPDLAFLDQLGAIIVSAFIIKIGFQILFNSINDLLDTGISGEEIALLEQTVKSIKNVKGVHNIRTRKLANYIYIDLHVEVDGSMTVTRGHDVSEEVKNTLMKNKPKIIDVVVHLEPRNYPNVL